MKIFYKNKKIEIPAKKVSPFGKISGLMFKSRNTENLLFEFKKNTNLRIHSFFVFFPFLAVWLNKKNKVIEIKIVRPFSFSIKPKKLFSKLVELPFNNKNKKNIKFLVGKKNLNTSCY